MLAVKTKGKNIMLVLELFEQESEILRNLLLQEIDIVKRLNNNISSRMNVEKYLSELKNIYNKL